MSELAGFMKRALCAEMNFVFKSFKDRPNGGIAGLQRIRQILKTHPYLWGLGLMDFSLEDLEMAEKNLLMVYFAIAVLYHYRTDIVAVQGPQTPQEFADRNKGVLVRVEIEAQYLFSSELSSEQMERAVVAFLSPGQSAAHATQAPIP